MLSYWFWPNPGATGYGNPMILTLGVMCLGLFATSFFVSRWRKTRKNPITKKLTRSWARILRAFAVVGFVLLIARAEGIQFFSIRFFWIVWSVVFVAVVAFQIYWFRRKHYAILPKERTDDPRQKYLP